eukprot:scaffold275789_cov18-Tisochrysis_lutea.AAC.1
MQKQAAPNASDLCNYKGTCARIKACWLTWMSGFLVNRRINTGLDKYGKGQADACVYTTHPGGWTDGQGACCTGAPC